MSQENDRPVTCSIGLPVYNGENYLRDALESVLAQDFEDFELIIADNASTDATEAICREYAERYPFITYVRHPRNIGAAKNYNYVFHCAQGEFFNWLAHDDILGPSFLSECLAAYEKRDASTILIYPSFQLVDKNLSDISHEKPECVETRATGELGRLYDVLQGLGVVTSVFGMFRRKDLAKTRLIGSFLGSDYVLLVECGLLGKIERLDAAPQFKRRLHEEASQKAGRNSDEIAKWFDPEATADKRPHRRIAKEYLRSLITLPGLSITTRILGIFAILYRRLMRQAKGFYSKLIASGS